MAFEDGMFYLGKFRDNKFNGHGLLVHQNKDYYEGSWVDNEADGKGVFQHYHGVNYTG